MLKKLLDDGGRFMGAGQGIRKNGGLVSQYYITSEYSIVFHSTL